MKLFSPISLFILILLFFRYEMPTTSLESEFIYQSNDTVYYRLKFLDLPLKGKLNCVELINQALNGIKGDNIKVLVFEPGNYYFFPEGCETRKYFESNSTDKNPQICALLFENINNLVIEGNGCNLIFHDQMQPFTFDNCSNITLKNVNIDWENPLTAQAEIINVTDNYIDLRIDQKEYSYVIEDGKIFFNEKNWMESWKSTVEFDREGHFVVPQTGDWGCLGRNWSDYQAESIIPGIIRVYNNFERKPETGNILIMQHSESIHSGIFIQKSKNITIKDVNLFHSTGLGTFARFSENLTFDGYKPIPNKLKNRYFSSGGDGLQVSNCKGQVTVTNCEFAGLMGDPINVHGASVQITQIQSDKKLKCKIMNIQSEGLNWGLKGDKIGFIENKTMQTIALGEIENFLPINRSEFIIEFKETVPKNLETQDALENLTRTPNLTIKDSQFKSGPGRGILVSTPGKVVIENNIFESGGSAILIAGDANSRFESGAVKDVTIRNNTFTDLCYTSSCQFCEGIISIYPTIPDKVNSSPFHSNIRIENNTFHSFDYPVLYALSIDKISFKNNTVERSKRFEPFHNRQYTFTFEACKNISVSENQFGSNVLGKNILLKQTKKEELMCDQPELSIKEL